MRGYMEKIYLATPYTHTDRKVMNYRFKKINYIAGMLMKKNIAVFSPISHTHPIAVAYGLPKCWEFWKKYDSLFIGWCDELWVYTANGWKESIGVEEEIKLAYKMDKVVRYVDEEYCYGL